MVRELSLLPHMQWAWLPELLADAPFRVRMWKNAGDGVACQTDESRAVACGQVQSSVLSSQGQARKSVTFVYADVGPGAELSLLGKGQQCSGPDSECSFPTC